MINIILFSICVTLFFVTSTVYLKKFEDISDRGFMVLFVCMSTEIFFITLLLIELMGG